MTGLLLHQNDDVLILDKRLDAGTHAVEGGVTLKAAIPTGHKVARHNLPVGLAIKKYGQIIGYAQVDIAKGDHVHSHNCSFGSHGNTVQFGADLEAAIAAVPSGSGRVFQGYHRNATGGLAPAI